MNAKNAQQSLRILSELYKDARPALHYATAYELLIAVILSAQCTDERVNKVTAELFKEHNTPETMLLLSQEQLEKYIFSCGLYKSKAAHILSATKDIVERFGGQVPESFADLKSLAGVGQKTANVVSAVWFDKDAIAVDTHVFRVSNRLGLADANTPLKTEEQLKRSFPKRIGPRRTIGSSITGGAYAIRKSPTAKTALCGNTATTINKNDPRGTHVYR